MVVSVVVMTTATWCINSKKLNNRSALQCGNCHQKAHRCVVYRIVFFPLQSGSEVRSWFNSCNTKYGSSCRWEFVRKVEPENAILPWFLEQMSGLQGQGRKSRMFQVFDGHVTIPTATGNGNICLVKLKKQIENPTHTRIFIACMILAHKHWDLCRFCVCDLIWNAPSET